MNAPSQPFGVVVFCPEEQGTATTVCFRELERALKRGNDEHLSAEFELLERLCTMEMD